MHILKKRAVRLLAAMALVAASAQVAGAAGVVLKNWMGQDIKAVLCVDEDGAVKQVAGELKMGKSITVSPDKFPEYKCNRLAVRTADGNGLQYYQEPEPGGAEEITFVMDKINPKTGDAYPALLIESDGETYVSPAGVPFSRLTQAMQFGLDKDYWKSIAAPGLDSFADPGAYAVAFGNVSWTLAGDGIVFSEEGGAQFAEAASMSSKFSNSTIAAAFENLKSAGASPVLLHFKEKTAALSEEGKTIDPDAERMDGMDSDEKRWEFLDKAMAAAAEEEEPGGLRMTFANETFVFELVLDLEGGGADLTIIRKPEAAFG